MCGHLKPMNKNNLNEKALVSPKVKEKRKLLRHIYNSKRWKTLRNTYISEHSICECCNENDSTTVHHIRPFSKGVNKREIEQLAYDENNLMALCNNCHKMKHKLK